MVEVKSYCQLKATGKEESALLRDVCPNKLSCSSRWPPTYTVVALNRLSESKQNKTKNETHMNLRGRSTKGLWETLRREWVADLIKHIIYIHELLNK